MPREVDVRTEIETLEAAKEVVLKRLDNAYKQSKDYYEFWQAFAALNDCINSIIDKENNNE